MSPRVPKIPEVVVAIMIACGAPALVHAAEDPANSKLLKQCESAKGEVKRECEAVATKMITDPQQPRDDTSQQDVTHSSPAMDTDAKPAKPTSAKPTSAKPTPPKQADKKDPKLQPKPE